MTFHISHRYGGDDPSPPLGSLPALLDEVDEDPNDKEHVGVSVVHESGWAIGVYSGWVVTLENVEDLDIEPRHIVAGSDRRHPRAAAMRGRCHCSPSTQFARLAARTGTTSIEMRSLHGPLDSAASSFTNAVSSRAGGAAERPAPAPQAAM